MKTSTRKLTKATKPKRAAQPKKLRGHLPMPAAQPALTSAPAADAAPAPNTAPAPDAAPAVVAAEDELLDAQAAAALLDVKPKTLYAYASRGLLRSMPSPTGHARRYPRADVLRLKRRAEARSGHTAVAAAALSWGEPVLDSALTKITVAGPCYRGLPATDLARGGVSFETVAELLWGTIPVPERGEAPAVLRRLPIAWPAAELGLPPGRVRALLPQGLAPIQTLLSTVPLWAQRDPARFVGPQHGGEIELARARTLVRRLPMALAVVHGSDARLRRVLRSESVAAASSAALGGDSAEQTAAVEQALILLADHELNASAFAARVAASVGTDLYGCVEAALAVLSGPQHGGACDRLEAFMTEFSPPGGAARVTVRAAAQFLAERARRGESVPSLGHPLYPDGDPRTTMLLEIAESVGGSRPRVRVLRALLQAIADSGLPPATADFGIIAVAAALDLQPGAATGLFALGRAAGWVAHILEQRRSGGMLRPRARYVGP